MSGESKRVSRAMLAALIACLIGMGMSGFVSAQAPAAGAPRGSARSIEPFDLTGYWTSLITQDWRYRMVNPGPGEYGDIPINLKAKQVADAFNVAQAVAAGRQCEAYGAASLMRLPEHLHILWSDDDTLTVQVDAGMQTRVLHWAAGVPADETQTAGPPVGSGAAAAPEANLGAPSLQGYSTAEWQIYRPPAGFGPPPPLPPPGKRAGLLRVVTTHMTGGLLRKNGIPYSDKARLTEYWELNTDAAGQSWLTITTQVEDAEYLVGPFTYASIYQRDEDAAGWDPEPCKL